MTPLDFLRWYKHDERSVRGSYYRSGPLDVEEGDRVGIVLMNLGGPSTLEDVEPFLYNLLMDPSLLDLPVGGGLRHLFCKGLASFWSDSVQREYELIGGGSPLTLLTHEQAESLGQYLNDHFGDPTGIEFRPYVAMRYWHPFSEEAVAQMREDDVDQVVLLPLYPQYSKATSGSALAYWKALEQADQLPSWPTTTVYEYAANPKYVQALSERIDEGLQRFPRTKRDDVHLVFSAHSAPLHGSHRRDPYCCLVHATIQRVMAYRGHDRPYHTGFQNKIGLRRGLAPTISTTLERLPNEGGDSVLVVPLTFATDHLLTSYGLDIEAREQAETAGITHFEVTSGLNTHPLFLEALAEAAVSQLDLPVDVNQLRVGGDGLAQDYPLRPFGERPRHDAAPDARCPHCNNSVAARRWNVSEDVPDPQAVHAGNGSDPGETSTESSESES